jgi:hypothetical protein
MQHYWQLGSVRLWTAHAKKGRSLNCGRNIYNQFPAYTARWNFYQIHENDECTEIAPLAPCCSRVARSGLWRPLEATHLICPPPTNKQSMQTESDVICRLWAKASTAARALAQTGYKSSHSMAPPWNMYRLEIRTRLHQVVWFKNLYSIGCGSRLEGRTSCGLCSGLISGWP